MTSRELRILHEAETYLVTLQLTKNSPPQYVLKHQYWLITAVPLQTRQLTVPGHHPSTNALLNHSLKGLQLFESAAVFLPLSLHISHLSLGGSTMWAVSANNLTSFPSGLTPYPSSFGFPVGHHTSHASLGNTQQLYDMIVPFAPHDNHSQPNPHHLPPQSFESPKRTVSSVVSPSLSASSCPTKVPHRSSATPSTPTCRNHENHSTFCIRWHQGTGKVLGTFILVSGNAPSLDGLCTPDVCSRCKLGSTTPYLASGVDGQGGLTGLHYCR